MSRLTVLDQPSKFKAIDKSDMLLLCEKLPVFCKDAIKLAEKMRITCKGLKNVIIVGMGGSAIGGALLKGWLSDRAAVPIEICRDYVLPAYANRNSLVVAVSYSGETEETLSAFAEAVRRRCVIVTISSNGHLQEFSQKLKLSYMKIPIGFPPRAAIAYTFFPLVVLMKKLGIAQGVDEEIEEALQVLGKTSKENALQTPLQTNLAKRLASQLKDTIPAVYGFGHYGAVAQRLKCQFNENSKTPSKFEVFTELNHNEIVGWETKKPITRLFSIILIRDPEETSEIRKRIETTKQIVAPKVSKILEIHAKGKHKLAKMLSAMYVGDFVSIYLAVLNGVDPTPTKTIVQLKQELKKLKVTKKLEKEVEKLA